MSFETHEIGTRSQGLKRVHDSDSEQDETLSVEPAPTELAKRRKLDPETETETVMESAPEPEPVSAEDRSDPVSVTLEGRTPQEINEVLMKGEKYFAHFDPNEVVVTSTVEKDGKVWPHVKHGSGNMVFSTPTMLIGFPRAGLLGHYVGEYPDAKEKKWLAQEVHMSKVQMTATSLNEEGTQDPDAKACMDWMAVAADHALDSIWYNPDFKESVVQPAMLASQANYDVMLEFYRKAVRKAPDDEEAQRELAEFESEEGRLGIAYKEYRSKMTRTGIRLSQGEDKTPIPHTENFSVSHKLFNKVKNSSRAPPSGYAGLDDRIKLAENPVDVPDPKWKKDAGMGPKPKMVPGQAYQYQPLTVVNIKGQIIHPVQAAKVLVGGARVSLVLKVDVYAGMNIGGAVWTGLQYNILAVQYHCPSKTVFGKISAETACSYIPSFV
jgi:hypothetical protein